MEERTKSSNAKKLIPDIFIIKLVQINLMDIEILELIRDTHTHTHTQTHTHTHTHTHIYIYTLIK